MWHPLSARTRRVALALLVAAPLAAQQTEHVDLVSLRQIREEGMARSRVMEVASYLTDVHGPRLTGSPQAKIAGDWTIAQLERWGISNPRYETWGPFGRGWSNEKITARMIAPTIFPLTAYAAAWTPGTAGTGPVRGEVVMLQADSVADLQKYRGKLRGKWVLPRSAPEIPARFEPLGRRWTVAQLDSMAALPPEEPQRRGGGGGGDPSRFRVLQELNRQRTEFLRSEGIAGVLTPGTGRNDYGSVLVGSGGSRDAEAMAPTTIALAAEHYNRIARILDKGIPVLVEIEAVNRFHDETRNSFNIIAEIPGADPRLKDELVMLGAHFDSWHAGTGATDNAAGSAVMLEAMRILKASGVRLRRTVRLALWTGEEQGLLGSRAYVREHFGTRDSAGLRTKPAYERFSAYFNMDNGTGAFRGVYLQGNEAVRPVFEQWMMPLRDLGMRVTTIRNTGGTDHLAFDGIGLPGFQFIQDPVEYSTRTHHTNQDVYDRLQEADLKTNAVIAATFAYLAANRAEKLPRKGLTP